MHFTIAIVWFVRNLVALLAETGIRRLCRFARKSHAGVKGGLNCKKSDAGKKNCSQN